MTQHIYPLLDLLAKNPTVYWGDYVYAQKVEGKFTPDSPAAWGGNCPEGMEIFDSIDHAVEFTYEALMEGDPDAEIADHEWVDAAKRLIDHVNQHGASMGVNL